MRIRLTCDIADDVRQAAGDWLEENSSDARRFVNSDGKANRDGVARWLEGVAADSADATGGIAIFPAS